MKKQIYIDEFIQKLTAEKKSALDFVSRRYEQWNENYELYRNKVKTNRLTQRQQVNIPLMKETIKTLLSKIDDAPMVDWKELSGDKDKELIFQEIWNDDYDRLNLEGIDIQDKKTVLLYGRSFKKLNWVNGQIDVKAMDIYDILVDPLTNPLDIESARYIIHQNIFRCLKDILEDDRYATEGKNKLKNYLSTEKGLIQTAKNKEEFDKKMKRVQSMGLSGDRTGTIEGVIAGGDVVINLTEHYTREWDKTAKEYVKKVVVYADDTIELMNETLIELMGVDFYPFITWAEDIETSDFWTDSPADLVRTPNKVLNIWFSQLVENRTLRNFQMHWYDATVQGYVPQTYEPGPGRMLPAPGDPNKTIMPVEISGLDETMTAIQFLTQIIERGSAVTSLEKGVQEPGQTTLGEVQILVGKATERTVSMAKAYRRSWQELCQKYWKILEANGGEKRTLYKQSYDGSMWPKAIYVSDWRSKFGYKAMIISTSEQEAEDTKGLQKFQYVMSQFPNNPVLRAIAQKRMLEMLDLTSQEMEKVKQAEEQLLINPPMAPAQMQGQPMAKQNAQPIVSPFAQAGG